MVDNRENAFASSRPSSARRAGAVDQALRSYMLRVYNLMALGIAVTAITVLFVGGNPPLMQFLMSGFTPLLLFGGLLGLGMLAPRLIFSGSTATAHLAYWGYAVLWGALIAPMVAFYLAVNPGLIFEALLLTVIAFGGASLYGYTTNRDLSAMGTFFVMALIGFIAAIVINFFVQSTLFSLLISMGVVVLISGVTAYETQMIRRMYLSGEFGESASRKAIFGAFMLFGSFITLFIHILNILGIMRGNE